MNGEDDQEREEMGEEEEETAAAAGLAGAEAGGGVVATHERHARSLRGEGQQHQLRRAAAIHLRRLAGANSNDVVDLVQGHIDHSNGSQTANAQEINKSKYQTARSGKKNLSLPLS
ncbi:Os07g0620701 [Oryza sativa Japonica Group]|uniref:Os07g0620701 protein n=1 Tax=Oryza sativa subsp. japonica TaxID=39947 RepID=A0A0P0X976_ORYSJ|nr:Os07g0620701 [Oryza sativa Japonica Group]